VIACDVARLDSPHELLCQLETHLRTRLIDRVCDFSLEARTEGLVLRGHARTYYAKQLAQHAVMDATDLPILANEIAVL
jgi:hypothetical protein